MSVLDFERRWPENSPGAFYVGNQCLDCDLCRTLAPTIFARKDTAGYSYVKKQPESSEEVAAAKGAVEGCCMQTIHADGAAFDWTVIPPRPALNYPGIGGNK